MTSQNQIAATIIAAIQSVFPVLNLTGVISLTGDDISIVMLCVTNIVTLGGLLFAQKQTADALATPPPDA